MSQLWVMDSECCEHCGALLGFFGECTNRACVTWEGWNDNWDEDWDIFTDFGDYNERDYLIGEYDE